ncbi:MAG: hypothetical protein ACOC44_07770 [Promethearchaeia archaeon]
MTKNVNKNRWLLGSVVFSIILIGVISSTMGQDDTYNCGLTRGSQIMDVTEFNHNAWKEYIGENSTPNDWFDGEADKIESHSKKTVRSIDEVTYNTYDLWTLIFIEAFSDEVLGVMMSDPDQYNFGEENVNAEYDQTYKAWETLYAKWNFINEEFEGEADNPNSIQWVLKNPEDYEEILANYNEWAGENNGKLQEMDLSVPNYTAEEFFWKLVRKGLIAAKPTETYGKEIISALDLNNTEMEGDELTIEKSGEKDFYVQITFDKKGLQNSLTVLNPENEVVYKISEDTIPAIVLTVIPIVVAISIAGIIYIAIRHKRKIRSRTKISTETKPN